MRILALVVLAATGNITWGMASNITRCESYLRAPAELKAATVGLLGTKTSKINRQLYRDELANFVKNAPNGLAEVADYLESLTDEPLPVKGPRVGRFAQRLYLSYMLRPENTKLAAQRLEALHRTFWLNFIFGTEESEVPRNRLKEGFASTEALLQLFAVISKKQPEKSLLAWRTAYDFYAPEIFNLQAFTHILRKTVAALEARAVDSNNEEPEEWERREYMRILVDELATPATSDAESMIRLKWREDLYSGITYQKDMNESKGAAVGTISPLRAFVFLYRLNHRLPPEYRNERFNEVELLIDRIRKLNPNAGPTEGPRP